MNKIVSYIGIFATAFTLASCDMGDVPAIGGTKLQAMAGEWFVEVQDGDGNDIGGGYYLITTSNTAANNETDLLLDDHETWPAKVVAKVDLPSLTFKSAENLTNLYDSEIGVSIIEGKILKNAATTTGGNKTDSIYVKFEFGDDPGSHYIYAGYRRTGFLEDEH
jgi:hypothetical protein